MRGESVAAAASSSAVLSCGPTDALTEKDKLTQQIPLVILPTIKLIASLMLAMASTVENARTAFANAFPQAADMKAEDVLLQLKQLTSLARMAAFILPFAKVTDAAPITAVYARTFEKAAFGFAQMYLFSLFMRVLLSWFPSIDWNLQPWAFLRLITEPYLSIYRGLIPALFGQLDFTPLLGFLILQDVVVLMSPSHTIGRHLHTHGTDWSTTDALCYFNGH